MTTKLLKELLGASNARLIWLLYDKLEEHGYHPYAGTWDCFLWAPGDIPLMLIAHMDTVHKDPPVDIYEDKEHRVLWSPDGLGADDRAGIYAILLLLQRGYRPHVLFTNGEESGGWGARAASTALDRAVRMDGVRALLEIDRRGCMEAVYYDCGSNPLREWVETAGFKERFGTFSDISILGEEWDIAAVNLSAGYYREHSDSEYLAMDDLMKTVAGVEALLQNPPESVLKHDTERQSRLWGKGTRYYKDYLSYDEWMDEWKVEDWGEEEDKPSEKQLPLLEEEAALYPLEVCALCEKYLYKESEIRWFDAYPLCKKCMQEVTG